MVLVRTEEELDKLEVNSLDGPAQVCGWSMKKAKKTAYEKHDLPQDIDDDPFIAFQLVDLQPANQPIRYLMSSCAAIVWRSSYAGCRRVWLH